MTPDFATLGAIGWPFAGMPPAGDWADAIAAHPHARLARVTEQHRSGYIVAEHATEPGFAVESLPAWQRPRLAPEARPAVGDWLLIEGRAPRAKALALLSRRSALKRAAAGERYGQQIIAANVDTVFIVCGLDRDFNPRRIERYLLLVQGEAQPVVVLTKADACGGLDSADGSNGRLLLDELAAQGVPGFAINAKNQDDVAILLPWLGAGSTAVVVGSSGAGKSTLTNTLLGRHRMKTGAVRASDARGRHTTTHRALMPLPSGACLIDTPGMRELKPTGEEALADTTFADLETLAEHCRFRNCQHQQEPGCALRAALAAGTLDAARLNHFLKLRNEIGDASERRQRRPGTRSKTKATSTRVKPGDRRR